MTQKQTILTALRAAGERGVTNVELNTQLHIFRYSARIHELREDGHTIRTVPVEGATVRFVLEQEAAAVLPAPATDASAPPCTDAEKASFSSPPGASVAGADQMAVQPGLFDTARMEFDASIPPLSPYDQEAA